MKNKLQYFICMPKQKYRRGKGRQKSILCLWWWQLHRWQVRWVHVPLENFFFFTTCISMLPLFLGFQLTDLWGVCNRIIQGHNKYIATVLLEWYYSYLNYIVDYNVWQKICITLEWSELNRALKASTLFVNITCQKMNKEDTMFSVFIWNHVSFQMYTMFYQ